MKWKSTLFVLLMLGLGACGNESVPDASALSAAAEVNESNADQFFAGCVDSRVVSFHACGYNCESSKEPFYKQHAATYCRSRGASGDIACFCK